MAKTLDAEALDTLFREAHTQSFWLPQPVSDETLRQLYDLMKFGPTSANCSPARILFLRTREAKDRLRPALSAANTEKTMAAPVTAILAYDLKFYDQIPKLFPHKPEMRETFSSKPELIQTTAFRNGTLQGGYFILAARSLGLDCGPMSGFNNALVDQEFFANTDLRSNFLCNLGYGDSSKIYVRNPRLAFEEACKLL